MRVRIGFAEAFAISDRLSRQLGEIFLWSVQAENGARTSEGQPYSGMDLRTIQDWIVRPQLRTVPGVADVNSIGGYTKEFHVTPDPAKLVAHRLTFRDDVARLSAGDRSISPMQTKFHALGPYLEPRVRMSGRQVP